MSTSCDLPQLGRIEGKLGRAFLDLPWSSAAEARGTIEGRLRQSVAAFERYLDNGWRSPEPWREMVGGLSTLFHDDGVCMVFRPPGPTEPLVISNGSDGGPVQDVPPYCSIEGMLRAGRWGRGHAAYPNRPASLAALIASVGDLDGGLDGFHQVYPDEHIGNQLRTVMTSAAPEAATCFVGAVRFGHRSYSLDEHQKLYAIQPAVQRWVQHMQALGRSPFEATGLPVDALDSFVQPAVILHRGKLVYANERARRCARFPTDLEQLLALATSRQPFATRLSDELELLVLPRSLDQPSFGELPPALRSVAVLLSQGASAKEIAQELDRPLSTVRTYTRRVFRRLGVHDRRELMCRYGSR